MMEKKSMHSLGTAIVGAVINIALNIWWIPLMGVNGSVLAMVVCYLVVFVIRMIDTHKYVQMNVSYLRLVINTALLTAQAFIMLYEVPLWVLWEILFTAAMLALNMKEILESVRKILRRPGKAARA